MWSKNKQTQKKSRSQNGERHALTKKWCRELESQIEKEEIYFYSKKMVIYLISYTNELNIYI